MGGGQKGKQRGTAWGAKGKAKRHCPERSARCIMLTDDTAPSCTVTGGSSSKDGRGAKGKAKRHCPERSARCIMLTDDTAPSCTVTGGSSSKDGRGAKGKAKRHCMGGKRESKEALPRAICTMHHADRRYSPKLYRDRRIVIQGWEGGKRESKEALHGGQKGKQRGTAQSDLHDASC